MIAGQQIASRVGHSAVDEHQHPAIYSIAISIHFPMLFQRFRRRCSRSQDLARAVTNTPAICSPSVFLHFHCFLKVFEGAVTGPGTSPAAPPAGPRGQGGSRAEPIVFARFFNGFHGFRGRSGGGAVGRPGGARFAAHQFSLISQCFSKVFGQAVTGPGAPPGGRPGGACRKPMNFQGF